MHIPTVGFRLLTAVSLDIIFIHDLRVQTRIGVYAWERTMPQTIRMDLEIGLPSAKPFHSGDYGDALDYAAIVSRLKTYARDNTYPLLERFTEMAAQLVLTEFNAPWVKVRVAKLAPLPGVREIGIAIERERQP